MTELFEPPASSDDLQVGDVRLRVYDWGNEAAPPMVLVHGIEDFALSLAPLAAAFRSAFHVVAFDLRGHGASDKPGIYSLPHFEADLHGLLGAHGLERPVLVGHSLGGQVVAQYAGLFDEVARAVVSIEGLGPPFRDGSLPDDVRRRRSRAAIETLLRGPVERRSLDDLEAALEAFGRVHPRLDADLARRLIEHAVEPHPEGGLRWRWDPRVQTTWLSAHPALSEERWSWVRCPVLVVTGGRAGEFWSRRRGVSEEDSAMPASELERRLALFRGARSVRHVELTGAGHMVHYDAPRALAEAIAEFLGSL